MTLLYIYAVYDGFGTFITAYKRRVTAEARARTLHLGRVEKYRHEAEVKDD